VRRNHPCAWVASPRRPQAWGYGTCSGTSIRLRNSASSWDRSVRPAAYMHHQQFRIARAHSHAFILRYLDRILGQATVRHLCMYAASCKYVALTVCVCGDGLAPTPRWKYWLRVSIIIQSHQIARMQPLRTALSIGSLFTKYMLEL